MALREQSSGSGGGIWLRLKEGKFLIKKDGTEYAYSEVEARIANIFFKDETYEGEKYRAMIVTLVDGGDTYKFSTSMSSGYGFSFLAKLANIPDLTRPVVLEPSYSEEGGKKKSSIFVSQDGSAIKQYWTRDNPQGLPEMEREEVRGKVMYFHDKRNAFIEEFVAKNITPKLLGASKQQQHEDGGDQEESGEDIPF